MDTRDTRGLPSTSEAWMNLIVSEHTMKTHPDTCRQLHAALASQLEFVLINDEARGEWIKLIEAGSGLKKKPAWTAANRKIVRVLQNGLGALEIQDLFRLGLDKKTIRRWSALILGTLPDFWWQALLVHGRKFQRSKLR